MKEAPKPAVTTGGVSGSWSASEAGRFRVAPTVTDKTNVLRPALRPTACWRIESHRFDVGSSFVLPNGAIEFAALAEVRPPATDASRAKALRLSVFGHADATGTVADNKALSGRRALTVYGLLVRDAATWEALYSKKVGSDDWGLRSIQWMLNALGYPCGAVNGQAHDRNRQALEHFQSDAGVAPSGKADAATRKQLFAAYMDLLCADADGVPFQYVPEDFLGGPDPKHKGSCQGCSEHNPIVVPSQQHAELLAKPTHKTQRDEEYRNNRRVVVYMFAPGLPIDMSRWPCPDVDASADGCQAMFWKDGRERREPQGKHREHARGEATFSCRFYDSMTRFSPCEAPRRTVAVWLHDPARKRMANTVFRLTAGGETILGRSDGEGKARAEGVFKERHAVIEWGKGLRSRARGDEAAPSSSEFLHRAELLLDIDDFREAADEDLLHEAMQRLANLGYHTGNFYSNLAAFQRDYGLAEKDWPDSATREALWATHANGDETALREEEDEAAQEPQFEPLFQDDSR